MGSVESVPQQETERPQPTKRVPQRVKEDADGYTDAEYAPSITRLEYELEDFGGSVQHTLGSIAGNEAPRRRRNTTRRIEDV